MMPVGNWAADFFTLSLAKRIETGGPTPRRVL